MDAVGRRSFRRDLRVTSRWPVNQTVSLERKLKTMSELVLAGFYTPEYFFMDYPRTTKSTRAVG